MPTASGVGGLICLFLFVYYNCRVLSLSLSVIFTFRRGWRTRWECCGSVWACLERLEGLGTYGSVLEAFECVSDVVVAYGRVWQARQPGKHNPIWYGMVWYGMVCMYVFSITT